MTTDEAIAIAAAAHAGQRDERGESYLFHPLRVMLSVPPEAQVVAVLHDVVERSGVTLADLAAAGLSQAEVDAVDLLSRDPDRQTYDEYIDRIGAAAGRAGLIARTVKTADLEDKLVRPTLRPGASIDRYRAALARVRPADGVSWTRIGASRTRGATAR